MKITKAAALTINRTIDNSKFFHLTAGASELWGKNINHILVEIT